MLYTGYPQLISEDDVPIMALFIVKYGSISIDHLSMAVSCEAGAKYNRFMSA